MKVNTKRNEWLYDGTILEIKRAGSSSMGNPTWDVTFEGSGIGSEYVRGVTYRTQTNGSVGYSINNPEYRDVEVTVALTRAGRIFAIEVAS